MKTPVIKIKCAELKHFPGSIAVKLIAFFRLLKGYYYNSVCLVELLLQ